MKSTRVSVLYVDPGGPYPSLVEDWWGLPSRDAKLYRGPNPVVAHPPCGPWGDMWRLCKFQDPKAGLSAVKMVQRWGGILEQPRGSMLFQRCKLPKPGEGVDRFGGESYFLEQVAWGHACRKPTWLYVVGVSHYRVIRGLRTGGTPTHQIWGSRGSLRHNPNLKGAWKELRMRSPVAFAKWLVSLASHSSGPK